MRTILTGVMVVTLLAAGVVGARASDGAEANAQVWEDLIGEAAAVVAQAPAPSAPAGPRRGDGMQRVLNLTDEQARRVAQIMAAHRTRTERVRIDLSRARLDAREAMLEATPDRARLDAVARRIGELQGQLTRARFDLTLELRAVLNPEQMARFQRMLTQGGRPMRRAPR
jgi:Spy/CpxP family protein refolding chaperone